MLKHSNQMLKVVLVLMVFGVTSCASRGPSRQTQDLISRGLNQSSEFGPLAQSRFWVFENNLVHFVTNVNERNRSQVPLIYIHGLGGSGEDFSELIKVLHGDASSRPFYALDLPPFGGSFMKEGTLSIPRYAQILEKFVELEASQKVVLVCHSMGGQVCLEFALAHANQIAMMTLISPAGLYDRSAYVQQTATEMAGVNVSVLGLGMSWYDQEFARRMVTDNPAALMAIESFRSNFRNRVQDLKVKTLVVWGRDDKVMNFASGPFLKENVEGAALYVIEGAGHNSMKTHGKQISNLIQKSL